MILVTGASGFVGSAIMQHCKGAVACPSLRGLTEDEIQKIVNESGAEAIVHTAAVADIGQCAAHPEEAYYANVQIPLFLARAAKGRKLICFSSDQVYGGSEDEGPYTEEMAKPANLYAKQKLEMEQRVLERDPNAVMLRAEWMYDYYLKKSNYFMNILQGAGPFRFSSRQYRGVTYVKEVAENLEKVLHLPGGAYNFGSETRKSMYEITREYLAYLGKEALTEDIPPAHNLWMNCNKAQKHGVIFSTVEEALKRCAEDHKALWKQ